MARQSHARLAVLVGRRMPRTDLGAREEQSLATRVVMPGRADSEGSRIGFLGEERGRVPRSSSYCLRWLCRGAAAIATQQQRIRSVRRYVGLRPFVGD